VLLIVSCTACLSSEEAGTVAATSAGSAPAARAARPSALSQCVRAYRDRKAAAKARRELTADLRKFVSGRAGRVGVMVRDLRTGATVGYRQDMHEWITASGAKVDILVTLLRQARASHRRLSAWERDAAVEMITHSDNRAADALYRRIGGGAAVEATYRKLRMRDTTPGPSMYWGGTTTSPADRVRLMTALVQGAAGLHADDRRYVLELMEHVEHEQRWGISAAARVGDHVALKNGWTPRPFVHNTWAVTSYGVVYGADHDYVLSVQTDVQPDMGVGIATIEHISKMIADRLPQLDEVRHRRCRSMAD
jgi:hypothetical protein